MAKASLSPPGSNPPSRRSHCPVACSLDIFGDRWTLLIVRDLVLGRNRFKDFASSPEKIPTNILSDRLERLLTQGFIIQVPSSVGSRRLAYELTEKGQSLIPVLRAIRDWGLKWEPGTEARMVPSS
ncbi:HxlR family transcriptional regulator [Prosthecobacter fusiformis]|uniref:HxlR family transcriptional regulator n=1 Tax=Prosthecobacter fusiformis TaxID=48464 RepID=A0A4R7SRH7_9BACT|nr:helix-turn-helix domain-containing protein [Prosthecobacter fusiformis]TDU81209.1 HxlR family transcriptional regulator [Prosthecobacter fusiformis]